MANLRTGIDNLIKESTAPKPTTNTAYHAGDLGKSEYWNQQVGSDRGTGHFGTGTWYVGHHDQIKGYKHPRVSGVWHSTGKTDNRNGKNYNEYQNETGEPWLVSDDFAKQFEEAKEPIHSFKLDKSKYPDVEETPYGFIYNVGGSSITDLRGQRRAFGEDVDDYKDYGFTYTRGGDEINAPSFEEAYQQIKRRK